MTRTVLMTLALPDGTGAHRMAAQFAGALQREGHRVILVCGSGRKVDADPLLLGGSDSGVRGEIEVLRRDGFQSQFAPSLVPELQRLVAREAVECVIGFQQADRKYATLAALRAGIPCVIHAGNQHTFWGPRPLPSLKEWLYGHLLRRGTDLVICTSEKVQAECVQRFRLPPDRTRVLPNGIDVRGFPRSDPDTTGRVRAELGLDPDDTVLVNVGRLDLQKGQDILLHAFAPIAAAHPRVKLVLVGAVTDSRNRERMDRFAHELRDFVAAHALGRQVIFAGWRDDIPRLLGASDLYVHAARWEGPPLCLSVLEAMAAALPVILTDCSGHPAGFENGTHGFVVASEAVQPLQDAVSRVVSSTREERRAMGKQARALALERYDQSALAVRFVEHVESVLSPRGS